MAIATNLLHLLALGGLAAAAAPAQLVSNPACNPVPAARVLDLSEERQLACFNDWLARGMPAAEGDTAAILTRARSQLTLPVLERRIEEVMASATPLDYFTDKKVDPKRFVDMGAADIAWAGNEEALRQCAKLMQIDEERFSRLHVVQSVLGNARDFGNPYLLAYRGFEMGSEAIDKGIIDWAEGLLRDEMARFSHPSYDRIPNERRRWVEALIQRYGGVPSDEQWKTDPLASRLEPALAAALHDSVMRYAAEEAQGRAPK